MNLTYRDGHLAKGWGRREQRTDSSASNQAPLWKTLIAPVCSVQGAVSLQNVHPSKGPTEEEV